MTPKILVADNDRGHLRIMREYLRKKGYAVVSAHSVPRAKRLLQNDGVDLAILDMRLTSDRDGKDISGLTLAKTTAPNVPKILLTRFPNYLVVREALRSCKGTKPAVIDFILKPQGLVAIGMVVEGAVQNALGTFRHQEFFDNLKSGDRETWRLLWDAEAWRVISLVQRHGFGVSDSKAICLDVFRNVAQADRPPRSKTLKAALVNEALRQIKSRGSKMTGTEGHRRRAALKTAGESAVFEELREDIVAVAVKNKISDAAFIDQVKRAVEALPRNHRKAVVMYLFEDDSIAAIAKRINVSQRTVEKYLKTATEHLRKHVKGLEDKDV